MKPFSDIETLNNLPSILTIYYEKTLRFYAEQKWNGNEAHVKRLARGLCLGLGHMHQLCYTHRDIKIDNILLQNSEGDPIIIDFGLINAKSRAAGTLGYMAPE